VLLERTDDAVSTVRRIGPMLAVAEMDRSLGFYASVLGFTVARKGPEYSIVERDGATIHLMLAAADAVLEAVRGHTEIYIEVEGITELWEHVRTLKGKYRIKDLHERPYGMTEFHIEDPNSCRVFVGQPTTTF